jgi:hypothetical protein
LRLVRDQIAFRMHETASHERIGAYHFALLALRHLPQIFESEENAALLSRLKRHIEKIPFFLLADSDEEHLACQLAFWLCKPITLIEIIETSASPTVIANALFALLAMGRPEWVEENLSHLKDPRDATLVEIGLLYFKRGPKAALEVLIAQLSSSATNREMRCAYFLFDRALLEGKSSEVLPYFSHFPNTPFLDALHASACLLQNAWQRARQVLELYPQELLNDESSPLFVTAGCLLRHTEQEPIALAHFGGSVDLPYPPTSMLLSCWLQGQIDEKKGWVQRALSWEKIALLRQKTLYLHCAKNPKHAEQSLRATKQLLKDLATG